ncbi:hypothetical protein LJB89_01595 [Tyzzerella sp. OttesenSCG-928-J15]|nr:hypothetical protein [Tyzzerella sp. OttesenSCG-928-J15]
MGQRMKIPEAAKRVGLSEYALRMGCKRGKYPHITIGSSGAKKRILIDIDLLEQYLEQEAKDNVTYIAGQDETVDYGQLRKVPEAFRH